MLLVQDASIVKNAFLARLFKDAKLNEIILRYENFILIKRQKGFLQLHLVNERKE